jgi:hypothetical protein
MASVLPSVFQDVQKPQQRLMTETEVLSHDISSNMRNGSNLISGISADFKNAPN